MTAALATVLVTSVIIGSLFGAAVMAYIHEKAVRTRWLKHTIVEQSIHNRRLACAVDRIADALDNRAPTVAEDVGFRWQEQQDEG